MRLLRNLAYAVARALSSVSLAAVPWVLLMSLWLTGCANVTVPADWDVWPAKETAPRKLPTPTVPAARPTAQMPSIQRVLRPTENLTLPPYLAPPLVQPGTNRAAPASGIRIAMLVPLTGPSASIGGALLDAAQLALFDVGDERLILLPKDTGGTPEGAARAAEEAVAEGAELILGPLFSQSVAAAAPAARRHGVNMIAFSTDREVAGQGVYLFGFLPREQIDRVVAHAVDQGLMRFAALLPETAYGGAILDALSAATARRGAQIIQVETYPDTGENPHEAVQRLADYPRRKKALMDERERIEELGEAEAKPLLAELEGLETLGELEYDAVILPEGGDRLRRVALLLPYYDIDPATIRFIGTGLWDDENIGREPALVGGWFAGVPPKLSRAFADRFAGVYGNRPPRIASIAYDSLALAALLAGESMADTRQRFSADRLTAATGFAGANGLFRLRREGLTERGLAVIQVGRNGTRVIDPPPDAFPVTTLGPIYGGPGYGGSGLRPGSSPGAQGNRRATYP